MDHTAANDVIGSAKSLKQFKQQPIFNKYTPKLSKQAVKQQKQSK